MSPRDAFGSYAGTVYCFADDPKVCRQLLSGGARIIQFRNKDLDNDAFIAMTEEMVAMVHETPGRLLIVNDRVDAAIACGADGVHVGAEDEDYRQVIARVPEHMIVGVSIDNEQEAIQAQEDGATYVGAGAIFATATKPDAPVMGLDGLRAVVAAVGIPVVAIGGITLKNVAQVMAAGVHSPAIISGINNSGDIPQRLKEFFKIIQGVEK